MQHSSQLADDFCCCLRTSEIICEEIRRSARSFLFRFYTEKQIWFSLNFDFFCLGSTSLKSFLSYYNKNTGNVYVKWRKTYSVNCIWGTETDSRWWTELNLILTCINECYSQIWDPTQRSEALQKKMTCTIHAGHWTQSENVRRVGQRWFFEVSLALRDATCI